MTIKKQYLELLYKALGGYKTEKLAEARTRDSFMKTISEPLDGFIKDRNTIYVKFCKKNEDGEPTIVDDKYSFNREVMPDLSSELSILVEEEVVIPEIPTTTIESVKEFIENTKYETLPGESFQLDEIIKLL